MTVGTGIDSPLAGRTVAGTMRRGVITAQADLSPHAIAAIMAAHEIHAVVGDGEERTVMTDLDVIAAALEERPSMALRAGEPLPVVYAGEELAVAAGAMADAGVSHAVVEAVESPAMIGMLSAFDIAAVAGGHDPAMARMPRSAPAPLPARSRGRLERHLVEEVMHRGLVTLGAGASVRDVARTIGQWRIHAVAITGIDTRSEGEHLVWSIASVNDVLGGIVRGELFRHAYEVAATEPLVVDIAERLDVAAARMVEHDVTHAVVTGTTAFPEGVLSTLDVLRVLAI